MFYKFKPALKRAITSALAGILLCNQFPFLAPKEVEANGYLGSSIGNSHTFSPGNIQNAHSKFTDYLLRLSVSLETEEAWYKGYDSGLYPATKAYGLFMGSSSGSKSKNIMWTDTNFDNNGSTRLAYASSHPAVSFTGSYSFNNTILDNMAGVLYNLILQNGSYNGNLTSKFNGDATRGLSHNEVQTFIEAMEALGADDSLICDILSIPLDDKLTSKDSYNYSDYDLRISLEPRDSIAKSKTSERLDDIDFTGAYLATFFKLYQLHNGSNFSTNGSAGMDKLSADEILNIFTGKTTGYHFNICFENYNCFKEGGTNGVTAWCSPLVLMEYYHAFNGTGDLDYANNLGMSTHDALVKTGVTINNSSGPSGTQRTNLQYPVYGLGTGSYKNSYTNPESGSGGDLNSQIARWFFCYTTGEPFAKSLAYYRDTYTIKDTLTLEEVTVWDTDFPDAFTVNGGTVTATKAHIQPNSSIWNLNVISNATPDKTSDNPERGDGSHSIISKFIDIDQATGEPKLNEDGTVKYLDLSEANDVNYTYTTKGERIIAEQSIDFKQSDENIEEILKTFKTIYDNATVIDNGSAGGIAFTNLFYNLEKTPTWTVEEHATSSSLSSSATFPETGGVPPLSHKSEIDPDKYSLGGTPDETPEPLSLHESLVEELNSPLSNTETPEPLSLHESLVEELNSPPETAEVRDSMELTSNLITPFSKSSRTLATDTLGTPDTESSFEEGFKEVPTSGLISFDEQGTTIAYDSDYATFGPFNDTSEEALYTANPDGNSIPPTYNFSIPHDFHNDPTTISDWVDGKMSDSGTTENSDFEAVVGIDKFIPFYSGSTQIAWAEVAKELTTFLSELPEAHIAALTSHDITTEDTTEGSVPYYWHYATRYAWLDFDLVALTMPTADTINDFGIAESDWEDKWVPLGDLTIIDLGLASAKNAIYVDENTERPELLQGAGKHELFSSFDEVDRTLTSIDITDLSDEEDIIAYQTIDFNQDDTTLGSLKEHFKSALDSNNVIYLPADQIHQDLLDNFNFTQTNSNCDYRILSEDSYIQFKDIIYQVEKNVNSDRGDFDQCCQLKV